MTSWEYKAICGHYIKSRFSSAVRSLVSSRHGEFHHTLAVPAAAASRPKPQTSHLLDVQRRRVQAAQVRGGGQAVGAAQEQDQHELWQAEQSPALLLRQSTQRVHFTAIKIRCETVWFVDVVLINMFKIRMSRSLCRTSSRRWSARSSSTSLCRFLRFWRWTPPWWSRAASVRRVVAWCQSPRLRTRTAAGGTSTSTPACTPPSPSAPCSTP